MKIKLENRQLLKCNFKHSHGYIFNYPKLSKKICQPCKATFNSLPEKFLATESLVLQKFIEMRPVLTFLIFGSCWSELNELLPGWLSAKCFGGLHISLRSSCPEVFCKKGVLKNFTTLIRKHLCQSLF